MNLKCRMKFQRGVCLCMDRPRDRRLLPCFVSLRHCRHTEKRQGMSRPRQLSPTGILFNFQVRFSYRKIFTTIAHIVNFSVFFGIAFAATPTTPGIGCGVGAFFVNVRANHAPF